MSMSSAATASTVAPSSSSASRKSLEARSAFSVRHSTARASRGSASPPSLPRILSISRSVEAAGRADAKRHVTHLGRKRFKSMFKASRCKASSFRSAASASLTRSSAIVAEASHNQSAGRSSSVTEWGTSTSRALAILNIFIRSSLKETCWSSLREWPTPRRTDLAVKSSQVLHQDRTKRRCRARRATRWSIHGSCVSKRGETPLAEPKEQSVDAGERTVGEVSMLATSCATALFRLDQAVALTWASPWMKAYGSGASKPVSSISLQSTSGYSAKGEAAPAQWGTAALASPRPARWAKRQATTLVRGLAAAAEALALARVRARARERACARDLERACARDRGQVFEQVREQVRARAASAARTDFARSGVRQISQSHSFCAQIGEQGI
eukprot:CAMPEP_0117531768 /NCGR_PEP_ID=MMETSP0784-20121206/39028_1 /TAXON_ID=39447 /ORGANISM="" /LENGTH=386 /DNA_ID=CAMNT_0005328151 /DNA_START=178 /DNA_END=1339 /DNA_ORIENTATION=+